MKTSFSIASGASSRFSFASLHVRRLNGRKSKKSTYRARPSTSRTQRSSATASTTLRSPSCSTPSPYIYPTSSMTTTPTQSQEGGKPQFTFVTPSHDDGNECEREVCEGSNQKSFADSEMSISNIKRKSLYEGRGRNIMGVLMGKAPIASKSGNLRRYSRGSESKAPSTSDANAIRKSFVFSQPTVSEDSYNKDVLVPWMANLEGKENLPSNTPTMMQPTKLAETQSTSKKFGKSGRSFKPGKTKSKRRMSPAAMGVLGASSPAELTRRPKSLLFEFARTNKRFSTVGRKENSKQLKKSHTEVETTKADMSHLSMETHAKETMFQAGNHQEKAPGEISGNEPNADEIERVLCNDSYSDHTLKDDMCAETSMLSFINEAEGSISSLDVTFDSASSNGPTENFSDANVSMITPKKAVINRSSLTSSTITERTSNRSHRRIYRSFTFDEGDEEEKQEIKEDAPLAAAWGSDSMSCDSSCYSHENSIVSWTSFRSPSYPNMQVSKGYPSHVESDRQYDASKRDLTVKMDREEEENNGGVSTDDDSDSASNSEPLSFLDPIKRREKNDFVHICQYNSEESIEGDPYDTYSQSDDGSCMDLCETRQSADISCFPLFNNLFHLLAPWMLTVCIVGCPIGWALATFPKKTTFFESPYNDVPDSA